MPLKENWLRKYPNDESASVLLEKIKHEKSNTENKDNLRRTINKSDVKQMRGINRYFCLSQC